MLIESMIGSMYSTDVVHLPDSSGGATMVSGTFISDALSDSTLPSLERRSSPVSRTALDATTLCDTLNPHMSAPRVSHDDISLLRFTTIPYYISAAFISH